MDGNPSSKVEEMVLLNRGTLDTGLEMAHDSRRKGLASVICIVVVGLENAICIVVEDLENVIDTGHVGSVSVLYTVVEDLESEFYSDHSDLVRLLDNDSALEMWLAEGCGDSNVA